MSPRLFFDRNTPNLEHAPGDLRHVSRSSVGVTPVDRGHRQMSDGRTGTRFNARGTPAFAKASRMAATIAGVEEMHGGSPTPLAPSGACGSGSSISVATTSGMSRKVGNR